MDNIKNSNNTKYIVVGAVVIVAIIAVVFLINNKNQGIQQQVSVTGNRTIFIEGHENINESKICEKDGDCELSECGGCFSKEFLDKEEPELPCSKFAGYACICDQGACTEIKE